MSRVILKVELYESETPPWAEWEMWRETPLDSHWISKGTAPSLESVIDHALDAWRATQPSPRDEGEPADRGGGAVSENELHVSPDDYAPIVVDEQGFIKLLPDHILDAIADRVIERLKPSPPADAEPAEGEAAR